MFIPSIRMQVQIVLIALVISLANGQDRKITPMLNPGCSNCTDTLIYIKSVGSHDIVHQIWDFTRQIPTIIFAIGSVNSTLDIEWRGSKPRNFAWNEELKYSFAEAIDKIYEYDDLDDNGHIDDHCPHRPFSLADFTWTRNGSVLTEAEAMVRMHGVGKRGIIEIKLDLLPFTDYAAELPHLIHTANSTLVDVSVVNATGSRDYNASRFAIRATLVAADPATDTMRYVMRKSLDDEHTPGVFEIVEIRTPESAARADGGFVQFRPVAYTQRERSVGTSTIAHVSDFTNGSIPEQSTLAVFYRGRERNRLLVQHVLISFGETGDGYYKQHNYTAWSFTIGYGAPPVESFSVFVIAVICAGLGVPLALAVSGAGYALLRRQRPSRDSRERLTDDE